MKIINLTINGVKHKVEVNADSVLIDLLRDQLGLTGTKQSCDRKGQCGACTVIVNGKAIRSCLKKMIDLNDAEVITIEGLGTPEKPHPIQEAYVLTGAIQCGYCTPGMIMSTKALLDQNPNPTISDIKKALSRNLCRCTGYIKIIDAVLLAAKFLRKETTPTMVRSKIIKDKMIGESHPRPSSLLKACGLAKFTADIKVENALELAVVHSTEFHAHIKSIDSTVAKQMPGVMGIMTADDIKGTNRIRFIVPDQPVLCEDIVRTLGDPIAIVAAKTREEARNAAAAVNVVYEPLPVMLTPEQSLAPSATQIHKHAPNLCCTQPHIKGDAQKALGESALVVEADFSTQTNHQAPLEPEVCVSYMEGEGKDAQLVVIGRSIAIHHHAAQIAEAVGWDKVRYKEAFSGGHFGIKLLITSEAITAAAALHFKRAVRYIPSLTESMYLTSKRHAYSMKIKMGVDQKGQISACSNEFIMNKGAYYALPPFDRNFMMFSSAYNIPHVYGIAKVVYTNSAYGGAARGAGPPQTNFGMESIIDIIAEKIKMDPLEFRKMNSLKPGQTKSTGVSVDLWTFPEVCDLIKPYYESAKRSVAEFNRQGGPVKRGVGLGAHSFGIGWTGDIARVFIELGPDDKVTIYAAVADPGEGNESMLTQLAAHVLNMPLENIRLYSRDTDKTVDTGAASGSRMTLINGGAAVHAAEQLKKAMDEAGSKTFEGLKRAGKATRYEGIKKIEGAKWLDHKTGQGANLVTEVHNIQMAEVEVNTETGAVKVLKMTAAVDAGPIIHPHNFEGQIEGGMDQGVGFALREEYIPGKTKDWFTFKFPTTETAFDVKILTLETPRPDGALGSTGIGELTMISTAPAVINGIYNACGVRVYHLPATPEKIKIALAASNSLQNKKQQIV